MNCWWVGFFRVFLLLLTVCLGAYCLASPTNKTETRKDVSQQRWEEQLNFHHTLKIQLKERKVRKNELNRMTREKAVMEGLKEGGPGQVGC
jgi:hypothetical protein